MRILARLALGLIPVTGWAQGLPPTPSPAASAPVPAAEDLLLASLIQEALARNPDLARARSLVDAERERGPQARALPDPMLGLGLQNDGFKKLQIGTMETSYYQVMASQALPWPGKRGLRGEIADLGAEAARWNAERARLGLVADLKRAYAGLLLVRGQMALLDEQSAIWQKAAELTKLRYEVGQGAQSDLLRAQLEQVRLRQTRRALQSEERVQLAALNRLRALPPGTPVPTTARLVELQPDARPVAEWLARAEKESPELQASRVGLRQAERSLDLAHRERMPDFAVSAGLMPRGALDPMWQLGVSVSVPLWSKQKQQRAVAEQELRRKASGSEAEGLRNLLAERIHERGAQLDAALESLSLYRQGLLVQSEASFQASLAQYEAGRAPFLAVLEALNGWIADRSAYLQTLAQAESIRIAQEEYNLAGTPPIAASTLAPGGIAMGGYPGASGMSAAPSKSGAAAKGDAGATSSKSM